MKRREFIVKLSAGLGCLALNLSCKGGGNSAGAGKVCFGIISDVHQDLQADAARRLQQFIDAANERKPDFIVQLGDLSHGDGLEKIKQIWEQFPGKRYSVLGNHDTDHATKATVTQGLDMPANYYSYDLGGVHFVVLDLNYFLKEGQYLDYDHGNYYQATMGVDRDMISPEELEWLRQDLAATDKPTIVFSHQGLNDTWQGNACPNRKEVRALFREANRNGQKVIACFCGHHHVDEYEEIEGVHYFQINSAAYFWAEGADHYSNGHMIEYKDALYGFVTLDLDQQEIRIEGVQSEFLPPAPEPDDFPGADKVYPFISNRNIKIKQLS